MSAAVDGTHGSLERSGISRTERNYALGMLTVIYGFNFLDRQILVILQEPIKAEMGLTDTQLGLLTGFAFALFYVTAGIPVAWWADRGVRRSIIAMALAVWSGMTALSGLAQNYVQLLLARVGVGVGEAGCTPPAHAMISDYFGPEQRGTALAIYSLGIYLGLAAGFAIGGYLGEHLSWRIAFLVAGIPGLLVALLVRLTVKEPPRGYWEADRTRPAPTVREALDLLARLPAYWLLAAGCALGNVVNYGALIFNPSFLIRSHELSLSEVGFTLAVLWSVSGALGTFLGGRIADFAGRRDERWYLWVCALGQILALPFSIATYLSPALAPALATMFVSHVFLTLMMAPTFAMAHRLVPPAMRALASSILLFVLNLVALGCGPVLIGAISDSLQDDVGRHSMRVALLIVSFAGALSGAAYWLAARKLRAAPPAVGIGARIG